MSNHAEQPTLTTKEAAQQACDALEEVYIRLYWLNGIVDLFLAIADCTEKDSSSWAITRNTMGNLGSLINHLSDEIKTKADSAFADLAIIRAQRKQ